MVPRVSRPFVDERLFVFGKEDDLLRKSSTCGGGGDPSQTPRFLPPQTPPTPWLSLGSNFVDEGLFVLPIGANEPTASGRVGGSRPP